MPAVIELRLRAERPLDATTKQLHGLACAVFEGPQSDAHSGADKPFTVWPLSPDSEEPRTGWLLRAAWLRARLPQAVLAAYGKLRLGHVTCTVTDVAYRPATHLELASGPPLAAARLTFRSPTYFSQNGTDVVVPEPRLIAGSWRRRWNASLPEGDPLGIDDDAWREIHRALRLAAFDLRTERMDSGRGRDRAGFAGSATLRLDRDASLTVQSGFGVLARFAEFCGTGAQTTHGFGATSVIADNRRRQDVAALLPGYGPRGAVERLQVRPAVKARGRRVAAEAPGADRCRRGSAPPLPSGWPGSS